MQKYIGPAWLAMLILLALGGAAQATAEGPGDVIRDASDQIIAALDTRRAELR